jgi:proteasome lid subunit RPN8/RPN11
MLKIPKHITEKIVAQGLKDAPIEACGILAGKKGVVERIY